MKIQDYILNQEVAQYDLQEVKDGESEVGKSTMESLLSLDDGRQSLPADDSCPPLNNEAKKQGVPYHYIDSSKARVNFRFVFFCRKQRVVAKMKQSKPGADRAVLGHCARACNPCASLLTS
ncbi:uncharacterized protein LOC114293554 [Camellia sinensis]|uniref:uncharacterized protein LOC114293554 n=1 Tax=Camellia sinensis TaxID=4442 RepID=UPI001035E6EF|nr:uncharacterized protein LOC114293554 [Camellia sinensis]